MQYNIACNLNALYICQLKDFTGYFVITVYKLIAHHLPIMKFPRTRFEFFLSLNLLFLEPIFFILFCYELLPVIIEIIYVFPIKSVSYTVVPLVYPILNNYHHIPPGCCRVWRWLHAQFQPSHNGGRIPWTNTQQTRTCEHHNYDSNTRVICTYCRLRFRKRCISQQSLSISARICST